MIEVHKIVAETFLPKPNQKDKFVVDHIIEDDKTNNHVTNLQWLTQSENTKKAWVTRKAKANGDVKYGPKLTERQKEEIIAEYLSGKSLIQITIDMNAKYSRTTSRQTYTKVVRHYENKK